jgi:thiol-disulfide isomerase/thioredoxin
MKKYLFLLLLLPILSVAQQKGMKFEHELDWKGIQAKAKAENKFIFVDCFTTWCGPCKFMSDNVFPQEEVGAFYNKNYINLKIQLDTTDHDSEEVKRWFADAQAIATKYEVRAYPTYLIFDPSGEIVHRFVGSSDAKRFIENGQSSMQPEKQYYTQLRKYEKGDRSPALLRSLAFAANDAYDPKVSAKVSAEYLATQSDLFTKDNLEFIGKFTATTKDKGFELMLNNTAKVNAVLGAGAVEKKLSGIVMQEKMYPLILRRNAPTPNWDSLNTAIATKYPSFGPELVSKSKVIFYQSKGDWNNFSSEVMAYMNKYGEAVSEAELNSYAWTVFENCKDMTCVTQALDWSKRSFKDNNNPMYMDTYANILYKMGRTKEAIEWEEKAVGLAGASEKKDYEETLSKMKKGEKTWKN